MRHAGNIPPSPNRLDSPYDPEARYGVKRTTEWIGYKAEGITGFRLLARSVEVEAAARDVFFGLQQAMRAGRVRVLLGTTEKCGIGVNIQTRLKALIDLDLPQRPDQLEQRHGRMRRSGNTFSEVEFYRMISEPRDVASPH
jgi:hypothetical protein